tara:strand:- start:545 stop:727 length:183 start_codon:yes stop_codon:yes gene_type:complete
MPRKKKEVVEEVEDETKKVEKVTRSRRNNWIDEVKRVQSRDGITYKQAMSVASAERKSKE